MQENCIFCKIIAGSIPSVTVYEDDSFKAILDIAPAAKGHVLILPKKHADNLYDLDEEATKKVLYVVRKIAIALKEELGCDGINLLQNNGEAAGQTVMHFHIHLIPRYDNDEIDMQWEKVNYGEGEAASMASSIAGIINYF